MAPRTRQGRGVRRGPPTRTRGRTRGPDAGGPGAQACAAVEDQLLPLVADPPIGRYGRHPAAGGRKSGEHTRGAWVAGDAVGRTGVTGPGAGWGKAALRELALLLSALGTGDGAGLASRSASDRAARWDRAVLAFFRIGGTYVARARPDGYTLLLAGPGTLSIGPNFLRNVPYDPRKDFEAISYVGAAAYFLLVRPDVAKDVQELIAKAKPGELSYASPGVGSSLHLTMELFKQMTGTDIVHIPYPGTGPSLTDIIAGRVDMTFGPEVVLPNVRSGQLKALAVSTLTRSPLMPSVAPLAELGVPGFEASGWYGMLAPRGTPRPIVETLNAAVSQMMAFDTFNEQANRLGINSPAAAGGARVHAAPCSAGPSPPRRARCVQGSLCVVIQVARRIPRARLEPETMSAGRTRLRDNAVQRGAVRDGIASRSRPSQRCTSDAMKRVASASLSAGIRSMPNSVKRARSSGVASARVMAACSA